MSSSDQRIRCEERLFYMKRLCTWFTDVWIDHRVIILIKGHDQRIETHFSAVFACLTSEFSSDWPYGHIVAYRCQV